MGQAPPTPRLFSPLSRRRKESVGEDTHKELGFGERVTSRGRLFYFWREEVEFVTLSVQRQDHSPNPRFMNRETEVQ